MKRQIDKLVKGFNTEDGAGVKLVRVLGPGTVNDFDPILMLDSFDSRNPEDYTAGFPMHPHRGIETISFVSQGKMMHKDSLGHSDTVESGEVQWMTAGSGIMHEELLPAADRMLGVQLWLNLPAEHKMTKPEYHSIKKEDIKEIKNDSGTIKVLAGKYQGTEGFKGKYLPLDYLDVKIEENKTMEIEVNTENSVMIFTLLGNVEIEGKLVDEKTAAHLTKGDRVSIKALSEETEVLLMSSSYLNERISWGGPIVMNNEKDLNNAFYELERGEFLKESVEY
ncbi:MAG: pirin family protein [Anaerovoracaceae bacterium]